MINKKKYYDFLKNEKFWKQIKKSPVITNKNNSFEKNKIVDNLYNDISKNKYYPSNPIIYLTSNKGENVSRIIPVFSITDYCLYFYCIKQLEKKIAINRTPNTFGGWSLGGAIRKNENEELEIKIQNYNDVYTVSNVENSFNPHAWSKAFGEFNGKLYTNLKEQKYTCAAELDIANFYDCIRLDLLERKIREISDKSDAESVSLLFHFLNYWNRNNNFYNKQTVGLPQDALADCSRILANFYLQDYDEYIYKKAIDIGCLYFRYADDQFFLGDNNEQIKQLIFLASKKLNQIGLNINQKKVKIWDNINDLIEYRSYEIFDLIAGEKDKDPINIEKYIDKVIEINSTKHNLKNRGIPLLNKAIWLDLKKIPNKKLKKIKNLFLQENYIAQLNNDKMSRLFRLFSKSEQKLLIKKLLEFSEKSYHTIYHYSLIKFFETNYKNKRLKQISLIKKRIKIINDLS